MTLDPPRQGRYIATRLVDFSYGLFASRDYIARHGPIRSRTALAGHRLVGYIDEMLPSPQLNYLDDLMPQHHLRIASSGMLAQLAAVRAGLGLGVLAHYLVPGTGLAALLPREAIWVHTFWLATHADGYRLRRVRVLWDYIRKLVEADGAAFLAKSAHAHPRRAPV